MAAQFLTIDDQAPNASLELVDSDGRHPVIPLLTAAQVATLVGLAAGSYRYQPLVWDDATSTWIPAPLEVRAALFRSDLGSSCNVFGDTGVQLISGQGLARVNGGGANGSFIELGGPDLGDNSISINLGPTAPVPSIVTTLTGGVVLMGFNGATPTAKPTITGSRGGNAALASLLSALDTLGLVVDSTTA